MDGRNKLDDNGPELDRGQILLRSSTFQDILSGRRRGVGASALRGALGIAECFYAAAIRWRNRRYDRGTATIHRLGVPVLSVGNLTLGGTGKTPLVRWIARWFADRGLRVAVVSRGYGSQPGQANDEALELARSLPQVPHLQNPDRVVAARVAVEKSRSQVIVLDDGFQHRRLARDLDIVLLDALEPFGYGHVFPRGWLREPIEGLRRANLVVLSRAAALDRSQREDTWRMVRAEAPMAFCVEANHAPRRLRSAAGVEMPLDDVRGQPVAAFCGIGNPAGFRHTLDACGCRVLGFQEFADHHRYTPAELAALTAWAARLGATAVLCTGKDLAKVSAERLGNCPLWAVEIELEFLAGEELVEDQLRRLVGLRQGP
jgi:tetraacyldisaccharide 4'-kinase